MKVKYDSTGVPSTVAGSKRQVLKDLILDAFNNDPGLCPYDAVVMLPDIEAYAPFLEAVFSQSPALILS